MRITKLVLAAVSVIFISSICYFGLLGANLVNLVQGLKDRDLRKTIQASKNITFLTQWQDMLYSDSSGFCRVLLPVRALRQGSLLVLEASNLSQKGLATFQGLLKNDSERFSTNWSEVSSKLPVLLTHAQELQTTLSSDSIGKLAKLAGKEQDLTKINNVLNKLTQNHDLLTALATIFPQVVGVNGSTHYTILLQNNMEIRPTGGFMGSYAQIFFEKGGLKNYLVEDIYVPDGAIIGHVNPPPPIQQAFKQGWWRLRDSNWDPDFPKAVETISWFFEKGGVDVGDGVIAINLAVVEDMLAILGEINLPDYGQEVSKENLYAIAQYEAERDFFPGSTQKRNFLNSLANYLLLHVEELSLDQLTQLLGVLGKHLENKGIQFYFEDQTVQEIITNHGWSGRIVPAIAEAITKDYLYLVESNLSSNKANCCVAREVYQKVVTGPEAFRVETEIMFTNQSPVERARPPKFWGGDYRNYLRILLPKTAQLKSLTINDRELGNKEVEVKLRESSQLKEYGFFVEVPHLQEVNVKFAYVLPGTTDEGYQIYIQKQSGLAPYWYTLDYNTNGNIQQTKRLIDRDQIFEFK